MQQRGKCPLPLDISQLTLGSTCQVTGENKAAWKVTEALDYPGECRGRGIGSRDTACWLYLTALNRLRKKMSHWILQSKESKKHPGVS